MVSQQSATALRTLSHSDQSPDLPEIAEERRDLWKEGTAPTDRREVARSGKFDRRRNRCGQCAHFTQKPSSDVSEEGFCNQHGMVLASETFACREFQPLKK
jgi:hypothetical protein